MGILVNESVLYHFRSILDVAIQKDDVDFLKIILHRRAWEYGDCQYLSKESAAAMKNIDTASNHVACCERIKEMLEGSIIEPKMLEASKATKKESEITLSDLSVSEEELKALFDAHKGSINDEIVRSNNIRVIQRLEEQWSFYDEKEGCYRSLKKDPHNTLAEDKEIMGKNRGLFLGAIKAMLEADVNDYYDHFFQNIKEVGNVQAILDYIDKSKALAEEKQEAYQKQYDFYLELLQIFHCYYIQRIVPQREAAIQAWVETIEPLSTGNVQKEVLTLVSLLYCEQHGHRAEVPTHEALLTFCHKLLVQVSFHCDQLLQFEGHELLTTPLFNAIAHDSEKALCFMLSDAVILDRIAEDSEPSGCRDDLPDFLGALKACYDHHTRGGDFDAFYTAFLRRSRKKHLNLSRLDARQKEHIPFYQILSPTQKTALEYVLKNNMHIMAARLLSKMSVETLWTVPDALGVERLSYEHAVQLQVLLEGKKTPHQEAQQALEKKYREQVCSISLQVVDLPSLVNAYGEGLATILLRHEELELSIRFMGHAVLKNPSATAVLWSFDQVHLRLMDEVAYGQGHCLFDAVAADRVSSSNALKDHVVAYLKQHRATLMTTVFKGTTEDFDWMLQHLSNDATCCHSIVFHAIEAVTRRPLFILNSTGRPYLGDRQRYSEGQPIFLYFNRMRQRFHVCRQDPLVTSEMVFEAFEQVYKATHTSSEVISPTLWDYLVQGQNTDDPIDGLKDILIKNPDEQLKHERKPDEGASSASSGYHYSYPLSFAIRSQLTLLLLDYHWIYHELYFSLFQRMQQRAKDRIALEPHETQMISAERLAVDAALCRIEEATKIEDLPADICAAMLEEEHLVEIPPRGVAGLADGVDQCYSPFEDEVKKIIHKLPNISPSSTGEEDMSSTEREQLRSNWHKVVRDRRIIQVVRRAVMAGFTILGDELLLEVIELCKVLMKEYPEELQALVNRADVAIKTTGDAFFGRSLKEEQAKAKQETKAREAADKKAEQEEKARKAADKKAEQEEKAREAAETKVAAAEAEAAQQRREKERCRQLLINMGVAPDKIDAMLRAAASTEEAAESNTADDADTEVAVVVFEGATEGSSASASGGAVASNIVDDAAEIAPIDDLSAPRVSEGSVATTGSLWAPPLQAVRVEVEKVEAVSANDDDDEFAIRPAPAKK